MVLDAPMIDAVLPEFLKFCEGAVMVAHNASFDMSFIRHNAKLLGYDFDPTVLDTVTMARVLLPNLNRYKLDTDVYKRQVFTFPKYSTEQVTTAFFGIFYLAVMLSYVYQVRAMTDGIYLVWLIVISSWGCDTCAYCVGVRMGKHKLAPVLSPKKSIEGAVGGVAGAALLGAGYALLYGDKMLEVVSPVVTCAAACAIAAVISQVGDLAASAIKRNHNVKDYGHLIPGHGGVLDRFDSMIFTAPAIYFALTFLM